jgi:hypothetical protein
MNVRETAIQLALTDLESGVFTSQRQAPKAYGIPRTTLQTRQACAPPHAIAHTHVAARVRAERADLLSVCAVEVFAHFLTNKHAQS